MMTALDLSLNLNQSQLIDFLSNQRICLILCRQLNLLQMAISKVCQSGKRIHLTCFLIKTEAFALSPKGIIVATCVKSGFNQL